MRGRKPHQMENFLILYRIMDKLRGVLKNNDQARKSDLMHMQVNIITWMSLLRRGGHYYDVQIIVMTRRSLFRIISAFLKIITHLKQ